MTSGDDRLRRMLGFQASVREFREQHEGYRGLLGTFHGIQEKLAIDFRESASIKHPGDTGTARENILRKFLTEYGYLPPRYGVSEGSSHVASSTGHLSAQADLVLFDALSSPKLRSIGEIAYYPIESCYGLIESKSDFSSRNKIVDGLEKVAAFKRLRIRTTSGVGTSAAFGVLFAFTAKLEWSVVIETIEAWERSRSPDEWPNLVVVADRGVLANVVGRMPVLASDELRRTSGATVTTVSPGDSALLTFYLLLLDLLAAIELPRVPLRHYVSLPATAGRHSYWFELGAFAEAGACPTHGRYVRRMTEDSIAGVLAACEGVADVNFGDLLAKAYEQTNGWGHGWGPVRLYNPDGLSEKLILLRPAVLSHEGSAFRLDSLDFEMVVIDDVRFCVPNFYVWRDGLISECPQCPRPDLAGLTIELWRSHAQSQADALLSNDRGGRDE